MKEEVKERTVIALVWWGDAGLFVCAADREKGRGLKKKGKREG